ncbi:heavy metal-associated isoprenylated plant protein 3 isoform X1 [Cinnamomum micranthum f. kanehirae]|uniref:Heavy metal-associated isoprenylated plant protein 3 isoform X1 n=1 Tax=Cinnamomum micranthum f. kanehirae TaxID=337451 RepID=A0A443NLE8_9MAGN|nr:heavy metal-associated isoprenylated plant protein 3 isoform X1 [Cinnamomum micranthum f. kanehirae]
MGKKKSNKKSDGDENGPITVILTVDMHCEGCSKKVIGSLKGFQGVEEVKGDFSSNKLTVVGKVDPEKIRDRVQCKTKKKVVLVSPLPKKDKDNGGGEKKQKDENKKPDEEKKTKEPAATTVVLKVRLHCDGCTQKIRRIISKTKGVELVALDSQKDLITLKGTIDFKVFLTFLQDKMKRKVEIVPPKKEDEGKKDQKKGKEEGKEKKNDEGVSENKVVEPHMDYWGYGYYGPIEYVHPPQYFSDENPNACSVM